METWVIILIIAAAVLILGGLIFSLCFTWYISGKVYEATLVRTSEEKWGRLCSAPENEKHLEMWNRGVAWSEAHKDCMREVEIENDGFHLFGEYYDFGKDISVIIIPGRSESLMYSYYFAIPYHAAGCNVLVIDIRSHGKSTGKYDYVCYGEDGDVLKWAALLHDELGAKRVLIHGICIGANTATMVLSNPACPEYMAGMVTEGGYISFYENYKQHVIQEGHPTFPVVPMIMIRLYKNTGNDVRKNRPIDLIKNVKAPVLMLFGKKDKVSLPDMSARLFERCGSPDKKIIWFEEGEHSHLRIANEEKYDAAVLEFVKKFKLL